MGSDQKPSAQALPKSERQQQFRAQATRQGWSSREVEAHARLIPPHIVQQFKRGAWPR